MLWLQTSLFILGLALTFPPPMTPLKVPLTFSPPIMPLKVPHFLEGRRFWPLVKRPRLETLIVPVTSPPTRVPLVNVVLLALLAPKALLVKLVAPVKLVCLVPR